jgi:hypothetical protein
MERCDSLDSTEEQCDKCGGYEAFNCDWCNDIVCSKCCLQVYRNLYGIEFYCSKPCRDSCDEYYSSNGDGLYCK